MRFFSSMKMYEYMAARRPIVTSDLPVIHEFLDAGSALFCPPEDTDAWAAAIQRLLQSPQDAASLAANAWQQVQPFSWTARAERALEGWV